MPNKTAAMRVIFYICMINLTRMNEEFHCMDLRERASLVLKRGQLLVNTNFYGASVKLYDLQSQFVEVYHHPVTQKIMRVSFASPDDLNKHLKSIRISA